MNGVIVQRERTTEPQAGRGRQRQRKGTDVRAARCQKDGVWLQNERKKMRRIASQGRAKEGLAMAQMDDAERRRQHWEKTRNLTIVILVLWAIFSFVIPWNAYALNAMTFMGFPLGYYFIAQGSLIAFVVLIFVQNWYQDKIDDEFGYGEEE